MRTFDPSVAREARDAGEPLYAVVSTTTEATECFRELGLDPTTGPVAFRAVALGATSPESITAALFDYSPVLVARTLANLRELAFPGAFTSLRLDIADRALRRLLGDAVDGNEIVEASESARTVAQAACAHPERRPLLAANAALPWPDEPHLVLWHALGLLHEWWHGTRVTVLTEAGVSGIESIVRDAAVGELTPQALCTAHGWADEEWKAAVARSRDRGVLRADGDPVALALTDPVLLELSDAGLEQRRRIDARVEAEAAAVYEPLGQHGCERLRDLCASLGRTLPAASASTRAS